MANSSVLVNVHGAALTMLLGLPPWGVAVELMPYKFDAAALYYHLFGNWAASATRTHLVWHNTNVWHASAGAACCVSEVVITSVSRDSGQGTRIGSASGFFWRFDF